MTRYALRRLVLLPLLLFVFSVTVFAIVQAPPGDFLTAYMATLASSGSSVSAEQFEALRRDYGLDQPLYVQYWKWMANVLQGNLGLSLEYQRPNTELIGERLVLTIILALFSFVFTWVVAIPIGIYSATHQRSVVDYVITVLNYIGVATPNFMLALILMWIAFAYLGISATGLFSPEYVDAPWSVGAGAQSPGAHLAAGGGPGRGRNGPAHPRDARQPPRRAEQALRRDRPRQGPVRVAAGPPLPRPPGAEPAREHDRLVPPRPLLRQPDRRHRDEHPQHRSAAPPRRSSTRTCTWRAASC